MTGPQPAPAPRIARYRRSRGVERQQLKWLAIEAIILSLAARTLDQFSVWLRR